MHIDEGSTLPGRRMGNRCGRRINRFVEPCLLLLLHGGESHGYELLENLAGFGFSDSPVDSSTVYRILRSLEDKGFVSSSWAEGDSGPARRVYSLSPEGDGYLRLWVRDLEETDRVLHLFFNEYRKHMELHHNGAVSIKNEKE
jgi:PadR family transcriptional regulator, regulatory protein PadR